MIWQEAVPGATSTRTLVNAPQPFSAPKSALGVSPMPIPEPLARQSAETATSPVSAVSLPSAQPGSSRSVWPSPSSSAPLAHAFPPPPGVRLPSEPPLDGLAAPAPAAGAGGAGGGVGAGPSPSALSTADALGGTALPHSLATSTPARPL